jgi:hypothetical protein
LIVHAYVLLNSVLFADKAGAFHAELQAQIADEDARIVPLFPVPVPALSRQSRRLVAAACPYHRLGAVVRTRLGWRRSGAIRRSIIVVGSDGSSFRSTLPNEVCQRKGNCRNQIYQFKVLFLVNCLECLCISRD